MCTGYTHDLTFAEVSISLVSENECQHLSCEQLKNSNHNPLMCWFLLMATSKLYPSCFLLLMCNDKHHTL